LVHFQFLSFLNCAPNILFSGRQELELESGKRGQFPNPSMKGLGEKSGKIAEGLRNASFVKTVIFDYFLALGIDGARQDQSELTQVSLFNIFRQFYSL
jgi:hypothetical protein